MLALRYALQRLGGLRPRRAPNSSASVVRLSCQKGALMVSDRSCDPVDVSMWPSTPWSAVCRAVPGRGRCGRETADVFRPTSRVPYLPALNLPSGRLAPLKRARPTQTMPECTNLSAGCRLKNVHSAVLSHASQGLPIPREIQAERRSAGAKTNRPHPQERALGQGTKPAVCPAGRAPAQGATADRSFADPSSARSHRRRGDLRHPLRRADLCASPNRGKAARQNSCGSPAARRGASGSRSCARRQRPVVFGSHPHTRPRDWPPGLLRAALPAAVRRRHGFNPLLGRDCTAGGRPGAVSGFIETAAQL